MFYTYFVINCELIGIKMNLNMNSELKQYIPLFKDIFRVFKYFFKPSKKIRNILAIISTIFLVSLVLFDFVSKDTNSNLNITADSNLTLESNPNYYSVLRVIDGDTIVVDIHGKEEKVRLIGVNTPESVDPRRDVECFGEEASKYLADLISQKGNNRVFLEIDPSQDTKDRYNRLLRYVYLEDGTFVNKEILKNGYGYEYTYDKKYKYQEEFKDAQLYAEDTELGLWGKNICIKY